MGSVAELVDELDLSGVKKATLLGFLWQQSYGNVTLTRNTRAQYENLARELGVTVPREAFEKDVLVRLDYDTGREVVRAA